MRRPFTLHLATLAFLQTCLLLEQLTVQQTSAAFQLPPFLEGVSDQSLSNLGPARSLKVRGYSLPSGPIKVPNARRYTPRKKHLKTHKLMRRLRKNWDPFWMSAERPQDAEVEVYKAAPMDPTLVKAVDRLNFTVMAGLQVGVMEDSVQQVLKEWLLQHSACHVRYNWNDLGVLYWPRWIRHGSCQALSDSSSSPSYSLPQPSSSSAPSSSCSWPPGMHCVPAESRRIRILRWQCRHNKAFRNWNLPRFSRPRKAQHRGESANRGKREGRQGPGRGRHQRSVAARSGQEKEKEGHEEEENNDTENWSRKPFKDKRRRLSMRCKWKKIPYPVIDDCFCSC